MTLFDFIINISECSIISLAIYEHFHTKRKELFIIFPLMLSVLCLAFYFTIISDLSIILLIGIIIFSLIFFKRIRKLEHIILSIGIIVCDILCNYLALLFCLWIFNSNITIIGSNIHMLYFATVISKLFFLLFVLLSTGIKSKFTATLEVKKWCSISIIFVILVLILCVLGQALLFDNITYEDILFTIISIIIVFGLTVIIYYKIQIENEALINVLLDNKRQKYKEKNYQIITRLSSEITESEHRMMYILLQTKALINNKEYNKANEVIMNYIDTINKFSVFINTNNPYFDFLINRKFNECLARNVICKANIFVAGEYVLEHEDLSILICLIIDYLSELQSDDRTINVDIQQENNFLICSFSRLNSINKDETIIFPQNFYDIVNERKMTYTIKKVEDLVLVKFVWTIEK